MSKFSATRAFNAYREAGLEAFEARVGEHLDRASFKETGNVAYGLGLNPTHEAAFRSAIVIEGEARLARIEAEEKAAAVSAAATARTLNNAEVADALSARLAALSGLAGHDVALINEVVRRLRAR